MASSIDSQTGLPLLALKWTPVYVKKTAKAETVNVTRKADRFHGYAQKKCNRETLNDSKILGLYFRMKPLLSSL